MYKDGIDKIIKESFSEIEEVSNLDKCSLKRAMRDKDSKRGISIWWVPLFGAVLSFIVLNLLPFMIVTDSFLINKMIFKFVEMTRTGFVVVLILTGLGMFKFNLKEEARL
ncbi:MAG: hypothetical protein ACRC6T_01135 [Sarcina sp.]